MGTVRSIDRSRSLLPCWPCGAMRWKPKNNNNIVVLSLLSFQCTRRRPNSFWCAVYPPMEASKRQNYSFTFSDSSAYFKRSFLSFFLFFLLNGASIYCINRKQHRTSASTKNETYKSCSHANPFEIRIIQNNSIKPTKLINRKTTGGEPTPPREFPTATDAENEWKRETHTSFGLIIIIMEPHLPFDAVWVRRFFSKRVKRC